jgi:hypothetical protein
MNVSSAVELINNSLVYKPGWTFTATDHTNRFEDTVVVRVDYPARNSNRDQAEGGYVEEIMTYASFPLVVRDCTDEDLIFQILTAIGKIEMHEAREFLRLAPTAWAPFHPHRVDGMRRWSERTGDRLVDDLQFGIA